MRVISVGVFCVMLSVLPVRAQSPEKTLILTEPIASFEEARALAFDPFGKLYVVDAGSHQLVILGQSGSIEKRIGRAGTGEGAFDQPRDVDPTNSLTVLVADAGNGRIERFSKTLTRLESLPVPLYNENASIAGRPDYFDETALESSNERGEPLAVFTTDRNETFVLEGRNGIVLKWNPDRRLERVIGGPQEGLGSLVEPVAIAGDQHTLYVADRGENAIKVYDIFGSYIRDLAYGKVDKVTNLHLADDALWIILEKQLIVYDTTGLLASVYAVRSPEPLVDVAVWRDEIYLLTASHLYRSAL